MKIWTAEQAANATNGTLHGSKNWEVYSISIDSRLVKKGDLFVALKGNKTDGHDYIREAFLKGAHAVMVEKIPTNFPTLSPILQVDDCIEALYHLAMKRRSETVAKIIGVTGSVGKTSTKEMLALAFSNFGITHATLGNLNNEIGTPLTLARMPLDAEFSIVEMGMNHAGEISDLTRLVRPHIAIITTVDEVHIEHFGSVWEIAAAKAEIFEGMIAGGTAILNADNQFFDYLSGKAKEKDLKVIGFGISPKAQARIIDYKEQENFILARIMGKDIGFHTSAKGKHMAANAVAALAAVYAAGEDIEEAALSLSAFSAQEGRGKILQLAFGGGKITLIDDSYNASPVSMRAALGNLGAISTTGRRIAVLGDMLELGAKSAQFHESLLPDVLHNQVDVVYTVGEMSNLLFNKLPQKIKGKAVNKAEEILPIIEKELKAGDSVLIKSSHGTGLYKIVEQLTKVKENAV